MDHLLAVGMRDGTFEPAALYAPVVCAPSSGNPSDGVWLTGRVGALSVDGEVVPVGADPHPNPLPKGEGAGGAWRALVVGVVLISALWGVAVALTLLALARVS